MIILPLGAATFDWYRWRGPDLNGVWVAESTPERPALTQLGLTLLEDRYKTNLKDFPYSFCLPPAPVPTSTLGGLWVVMHNRTHLATLFEAPPNYRLVFLDGRPHPSDVEPTWMGHSIGTWEGDTNKQRILSTGAWPICVRA